MTLPKEYIEALEQRLGKQRVATDALSRYAHGTDASFYSLIPQVVIQVATLDEIQEVMRLSHQFEVAVTFRAAGTSLSGQAITDSVLLTLTDDWQDYEVLEDGKYVKSQPGIIGAQLNQHLSTLERKIGPDPASINSCKIGGIVANNSSGMCCGVDNNSYHTLQGMSLVLADGTYLDTSKSDSVAAFIERQPDLIQGLEQLAKTVKADSELSARIRKKYRLKNTTGYGINALLDYTDPIDILTHLMVGSEGTLGFVADVTLKTVVEHSHCATGLFIVPAYQHVAPLIEALRPLGVAAIELMDARALKTIAAPLSECGLPLEDNPQQLALLIEVQTSDCGELSSAIAGVDSALSRSNIAGKIDFTTDAPTRQQLWNLRKGLFPIVGSARAKGTTVIIEDVAFELDKLADGLRGLNQLFERFGYDDAVIFGHALDGNLHFAFSQSFNQPSQVATYKDFMAEVVGLVSAELGGALKAEHGTGRNMAPFVEAEWGEKAYQIMADIKRLFDPKGILNPDVIISDDPEIHLKHLKQLPDVDDRVDQCIECGFCESACPSRTLTLTPRQRIAVQRRMASLPSDSPDLLKMQEDYQYAGIDTCAATGMCSQKCPVSIDTGEYVKHLRSEQKSQGDTNRAQWFYEHYAGALKTATTLLRMQSWATAVIGKTGATKLGRLLNRLSGGRLPLWHGHYPTASRYHKNHIDKAQSDNLKQVVFFASCATRTMGPEAKSKHPQDFVAECKTLFLKAGYELLVVEKDDTLCCGQPFYSSGFEAQGDNKQNDLISHLQRASKQGQLPVVSDTTPCSKQLAEANTEFQVQDLSEFVVREILPNLRVDKLLQPLALHITCSAKKLGIESAVREIAKACSDDVIESNVDCCGFAGQKGFTLPELNAAALKEIKHRFNGCGFGISQSRTCEIGLSLHSDLEFQSYVYLLNKLSQPKIHSG